jgi:hypothetical protein
MTVAWQRRDFRNDVAWRLFLFPRLGNRSAARLSRPRFERQQQGRVQAATRRFGAVRAGPLLPDACGRGSGLSG